MPNMIISNQEYHAETILHHINALQALSPITNTLRPETTLNFKYKVNESIPDTVDTIVTPSILFYGIGKGGKKLIDGLVRPIKPKHTDMDLFSPLPFRILTPNQSLTALEQELYRLPIKKVFDGVECTCYMLKCVRVFKTTVDISHIDVNGSETPFALTTDYLNPVPDPDYQMINVSGLTNHTMVTVDFNYLTILPQELLDIKKYYFDNDLSKVDISEWGLYSGYEKNNNAYNVQLAIKYCNTGNTFTTSEEGFSRNIRVSYGNKLLS